MLFFFFLLVQIATHISQTHKANFLDHCFCHLKHQKVYLLGGLIKAQESEFPEKRELFCFVLAIVCNSDENSASYIIGTPTF